MTLRPVRNRIAIDLNSLGLPLGRREVLDILQQKGIQEVDINMNLLAEELVGKAGWKWGARQHEAPSLFDCSSLTKWIYGQKGIWIPRRAYEQFEFCKNYGSIHSLDEVLCGDILFLNSPFKNGIKTNNISNVIGHVCIVVEDGNAVSATNSEFGRGVVKFPISHFLASRTLIGIGRIFYSNQDIVTFAFPPEMEIETVADVVYRLKRVIS